MCKSHECRHGAILILVIALLFNSLCIPAYATEIEEVEEETMPVETTTGIDGEDIFGILAGEDTMQDVAAYINYKRLYTTDMEAIKWSFILSQLAKPFEEDLSDVMSNDIILQMRDENLAISTTPDVIDSDYVYEPVNTEYTVDSVQFSTVWETITKNIRYNSLLNEDLQHYTVRSFLTEGATGKQAYISDHVFTDRGGQHSVEISKDQLKNNVESLFSLDSEDNSTKIIEYLRNPSLSLTKDPNEGVRGQRRLIPVFVGSEISNMYLQIGMMVYCKENTNDAMTFQKFLTDYGSERMYIDSYGNIVFFDSKSGGYKMVLPNACNSVLISGFDDRDIELYGVDGEPVVDNDYKRVLGFHEGYQLTVFANLRPQVEYPKGVTKEIGMHNYSPGWSEKTFMYNKLLGSVYSTRRRLTSEPDDGVLYTHSESDLSIAHYPSYIGPNNANRTDFRNSLVLAKPDYVYLSPNLFGLLEVKNMGSNWEVSFNAVFGNNKEQYSFKYFPEFEFMLPVKLDSGTRVQGYLGLEEILYNSIVPNNLVIKGSRTDSIGTYVSAKYAYAINSFMSILQIANDASMVSTRNMNLKDADETKSDGAIAFPIHSSQLVDVSNDNLFGGEGGFLEDYKKIYGFYKPVLGVKDPTRITVEEYEALDETTKALFEPVYPPLIGAITQKPIAYEGEPEILESSQSATYLLKRDNRISNRYSLFPVDDVVTLSYVWLHDYLLQMPLSNMFTDGKTHTKTQQFLTTAATGSNPELVVLPFDLGISPKGNITWCDYNYVDTAKTTEFFGQLKDGEDITVNPFSRKTPMNTRALWLGLYRNTDSIINPDSPIKFAVKEKTVDIDALLNKINYGIDNPLTKISNMISGLAQLIHNAISVGGNSNFLANLKESDAYAKLISWYVLIGASVIILWIITKLMMILVNREKFLHSFGEVILISCLVAIIPIIFNGIVGLNAQGFKRIMQSANDKTILVSVQKTIDSFINRDVKAEQNYTAYRQQFESLSDIYQPNQVHLFDGMAEGKPTYKTKSIDELVTSIAMTPAQVMVDDAQKRQWYSAKEFVQVQRSKYSQDFSRFFYDHLVFEYLKYYNNPDLANTSSGAVATQIDTDDRDVALRIDKVLHNLKGGFSRLIEDSVYTADEDVTGITQYMNTYVGTVAGDLPYLRNYTPILENSMRKYHGLLNKMDEGELLLPYGKDAINKAEPWRTVYYRDYDEYLSEKPAPDAVKFSKIDTAVENAYNNTVERIKAISKYRVGTFSDTSIMYTASLIAAQEVSRELGGVEYGVKDISDLDKLMRVIYANNTEDIYNEEAVMYVIQDRISGGVYLVLLIVLYELCYLVVTLINIAISVFAAVVLPVSMWMLWQKRVQNGVTHCFVGMITQVVVQLLSLYMILSPLTILSYLANKPMSSLSYWLATICLLMAGLLGTVISLKLFSVFIADMRTMGGSIITAKASSMLSHARDVGITTSNANINDTQMDISSAEINAVESQSTLETDLVEVNSEVASLETGETEISTPMYEYKPEQEEVETEEINP